MNHQPVWKMPEYTWGKDRELCKRCAHYRERVGGSRLGQQNIVMGCVVGRKRGRGSHPQTCIDMRYEGPCGREGKLFQERQA